MIQMTMMLLGQASKRGLKPHATTVVALHRVLGRCNGGLTSGIMRSSTITTGVGLLQREPLDGQVRQGSCCASLLSSQAVASTSRAFSTQLDDHHDGWVYQDEELPYTKNDRTLTVKVSPNGSSIDIHVENSSATSTTTTFHASWLLANDPAMIYPSSGQRSKSPISLLGWNVRDAQIVPLYRAVATATATATAASSSTRKNLDPTEPQEVAGLPCPPPPRGCLHPFGKVYQVAATATHQQADNDDDDNNDDSERAILRIDWEKDPHHQHSNKNLEGSTKSTSADTTMTSYYDLEWLWSLRYDGEALAERFANTVIGEKDGAEDHALHANRVLHHADYYQILQNDQVRFDFMQALLDDGAVLVQNTPSFNEQGGDEASLSPVAILCRALSGGISHGQLYGDTFHVQTMPHAHNIAYTTVALSPHQDLTYFESPPGIQLLHCLSNHPDVVVGGESTVVDAMAAADEFHKLAPDLFDLLTHCEATFLKQREGADMVYRRPHFHVDSFGHVVSVRWAPPFEGPLAIPSHLVHDYYIAHAAFERMIDNSLPSATNKESIHGGRLLPMLSASLERDLAEYAQEFTWEKRLEEGEMLVFNNLRMLHGRRGFTIHEAASGGRGRHLMGCYANFDETLNQFRLLRRQQLAQQNTSGTKRSPSTLYIRNGGNGSSSTI